MTTSISITHKGPASHDVHVEVVAMSKGGPVTQRTVVLKGGETSDDIALHDGAFIQVSEQDAPKAAPTPIPPPAPAPVAMKKD